ncbi:MAG: hypothetical protein AAF671_13790, partial [Pseudomonadota bacterium]
TASRIFEKPATGVVSEASAISSLLTRCCKIALRTHRVDEPLITLKRRGVAHLAFTRPKRHLSGHLT